MNKRKIMIRKNNQEKQSKAESAKIKGDKKIEPTRECSRLHICPENKRERRRGRRRKGKIKEEPTKNKGQRERRRDEKRKKKQNVSFR